ncbi:MAG TPA: branched-chain amino acid ABC transporter permease [Acidimicrobiales bacterium]|nr:branched-chain amino acid ABC transporter permease [Acidimicrobiales bacterium]
MNSSALIHALLDGVLTGSVYALMATGLTLIFGVMNIINVAQGILVILGAYLSYTLSVHFGIDLFVGLIITIPTLFVVGVVVERLFMARLKGPERTSMSILVTYAISLIIEGSLNMIYSINDVQLKAWYVNRSFLIFGIYLPYIYLFGFILAVALLTALYVMLYRTRFGASIRASLADQVAAALVGINVKRVSTICFGLGIAVTAAGGMVYGATNAFNASTSYDLISRLLTIIVLGGMGSLGGALLASILMVTLGDVVAVVWSPIWSTPTFFFVLVIVLSLRPQGLFGKQSARVA